MSQSIFPILSIDRFKSKWEDYLTEFTPVETIGGLRFKREDCFAPLGYGGINGSKVRQCIWLMNEYVKNSSMPCGVMSASSVNSPQVSAATVIGRHYGLDVVHVVGAINKKTVCTTYSDVTIGAALGASFLCCKVSYNPYLQKKLKDLASSKTYQKYFVLPYGISLRDEASSKEVSAFHSVGANQCKNIPSDIETLVVPAGSCNSCASIMTGVAWYKPKGLKRLVLFGIGPPKLEFLENRLASVEEGSGTSIRKLYRREYPEHKALEEKHNKGTEQAPYLLIYYDLHSTHIVSYDKRVPFHYAGIAFHPRYEGKIMSLITKDKKFDKLLASNMLFWVVGSEPSVDRMISILDGRWGPAKFEDIN